MAKLKTKEVPVSSVMDREITKAENEKLSIEDMPLNSVRDYRLYNEEARKINKRLGLCKYPLIPCPVELHPKQRVIFRRNDQPSNPLPVFVSDSVIHFDQKLVPGKEYDLPEYVVHYLSEKGDPEWKWFDNADGSKETRIWNKKPRFSLTPVYGG